MDTDALLKAMAPIVRSRTVPAAAALVNAAAEGCPGVLRARLWTHDLDAPHLESEVAPMSATARHAFGIDGDLVGAQAATALRVFPLNGDSAGRGALGLLVSAELGRETLHAIEALVEIASACVANLRTVSELESRNHQLQCSNAELEEEFRDAFEEAPVAYIREALDSRFIRANAAALKLLGISQSEVTQTMGRSLVDADEGNQLRLRRAMETIAQGSETRQVRLQLRRKDDGRPVWALWSSKPAPDGSYTRTVLVDITDQVQIEEVKAALEFSLDAGQVGDWDLDLLNDTSRRSLRHDRCFGYSTPIPEEEWGKAKFLQHVHPDDRDRVELEMKAAVETLQDWVSDFRVTWPDSTVHWLVARGRAYRSDGNHATRMIGIVMDMTDHRRREESLRETKAALDFAVESAGVGDWDLDLVHNTSRRSLRHDQCFGYAEAIPEGEWGVDDFIRHVHVEDADRVAAAMSGAAQTLTDFNEEFRVLWSDGTQHWLVARGRVYRTLEGKASRMLGVVMDITSRKRSEDLLAGSERLAHGQAAALKRAVDALAAEPSPERLAEHVLRTLAEQLEAQSCSVWLRDDASGLFDLHGSLEGETFVRSSDELFQGVAHRISMDEFWRDLILGDKPSVMEDIRVLRDSAWRTRLVTQGIVTVLMVPMSSGGRVHGAIGIRFKSRREFLEGEIDLARALANQTMLALQVSLASNVARSSAVVAERNRMARDIHDTLAQGFTGVIVQLEAASDADARGLATAAGEHVDRAKQLARDSLQEARRSVRALRPRELEDKDLSEAIEVLIRKMTAGTGVVAKFTVNGKPYPLPAIWGEHLLRIAQEVTTNMLRHARAQNFVGEMTFAPDLVELALRDDGQGFSSTAKHEGFGLIGMAERVEAMDGTLDIQTSPGKGATILIALQPPGRN